MAGKKLFSATDSEIILFSDQFEHLRQVSNPFMKDSPILSKDQIATFVETAYWSSLLMNEGRQTKVRLAAVPHQIRGDLQQFSVAVSYDESQVAKLSPAIPPMGYLLVDLSTMEIWGITRKQLPFDTITLNVVRPGVVQAGVGVYRTFMVFDGRTVTQVLSTGVTDLPQSIRVAMRKKSPNDDSLEAQAIWREALALSDVAKAVVKNGHGGTLLIVPHDDENWSSSIDPLGFAFHVRDSSVPNSIRSELKRVNKYSKTLQLILQADLPEVDKFVIASNMSRTEYVDKDAIDATSRLAAIDGAVVLTSQGSVVGFGAKIKVKEAPPNIGKIGSGSERQKVNFCQLENLGGMRHQSAARFVGCNHNCVALVVSEDGPMSFMSWHEEWQCVLVIKNADWWC